MGRSQPRSRLAQQPPALPSPQTRFNHGPAGKFAKFATLLTGWPLYSLVAASLAGFWLMESYFNAAPLHASLPAITAAEPVAGMLLGIVVFGDVIHLSPGMLALQAAGIAALVAGVILVARAPVLSRLSRPAVLLQPRTGR